MTAKRDTYSVCPVCGQGFNQDGIGRLRKFCSDVCRQKAHRKATAKRREYNTVRTDTLESHVATCVAKHDYDGARALRQLAKAIGAPLDEAAITRSAGYMTGVLDGLAQARYPYPGQPSHRIVTK